MNGEPVMTTDPGEKDTDGDGVPDGVDPDPLSRDFDGDGVPDGEEWVHGWNAVIVDSPEVGATHTLTIPLGPTASAFDWVMLVIEARSIDGEQDAVMRVDTSLHEPKYYSLHALGNQWVTFVPVRPDDAEVTVQVSPLQANEPVAVDRIALVGLPNSCAPDGVTCGPPLAVRSTFADRFDSDADGLSDLQERLHSAVWVEAEHFIRATDGGLVGDDSLVLLNRGAYYDVQYTTGRHRWGPPSYALSTQVWSVFLLRSGQSCPVSVATEIDPVECGTNAECPMGDCVSGTCTGNTGYVMDPSFQYSWGYAGTYVVPAGSPFQLTMRAENFGCQARVDKVVFVPFRFAPTTFEYTFDQVLNHLDDFGTAPIAAYLPGGSVTDTYLMEEALPWGLSDPLEPDTDRDGYRAAPHYLADSAGWLTDGFEVALRMNPFDRDSDLDARLVSQGGGIWETVPGQANLQLFDDRDSTPRPVDFDRDGIVDEVEVWAELCAVLDDCESIPVEHRTDCTLRRITGCVDQRTSWNEVLCWFTDDDRDDDGLMDGQEDKNRNGVFDADGGETDPNNFDTDGDCIPDGTEVGLVCPNGRDTESSKYLDGSTDGLADILDCGTYFVDAVPGLSQPACFFGAFAEPVGCGSVAGEDAWLPGQKVKAGGCVLNKPGFRVDLDPTRTTDPGEVDSDGDGLRDGISGGGGILPVGSYCTATTTPPGEDLNCNGAMDVGESDASLSDTDGDTLLDGQEVACGTCRTPDTDACADSGVSATDFDGDGLLDGVEVHRHGSSPTAVDTDGDALTDPEEVSGELGPITRPYLVDSDGDGLGDGQELGVTAGPHDQCTWRDVCGVTGPCHTMDAASAKCEPTNPMLKDTDGDGLDDGVELTLAGSPATRTNPVSQDTDGDGLSDVDERNGTGPLAPWGATDPTAPDTDGDGFLDETEVASGTDPTDATAVPTELVINQGGVSLDPPPTETGSPWARVSCVAEPQHPECQSETPGVDVITTYLGPGEQLELGCQGQPDTAVLLPVDGAGSVRIVRNDTSLLITATGALVVYGAGGASDGVELWRGETVIDADKLATPAPDAVVNSPVSLSEGKVVLDFKRPSCWSDADCGEGHACEKSAPGTEGVCAGTDAPDVLRLCDGVVIDTSATVTMTAQNQVTGDSTPLELRPVETRWSLRDDRVEFDSPTIIDDDSPDELGGTGDDTKCWKPITPQRLRMKWDGEGSIDTPPIGDPSVDGPGTLQSFPPVECPGGQCPDPDPNVGVPPTNLTAPSADWKWNPPEQFGAVDLANPHLMLFGLLGKQGRIQFSKGHCDYDFVAHRYTCIVKYEKKKTGPNGKKVRQWEFDARMDYDIRGTLDFETVKQHTFDPETFPGLSDFDGEPIGFDELANPQPVDCGAYLLANPSLASDHTVCDNGELKMVGQLRFPVPKVPLMDAIVDGVMVVDHSPSSNGGLFMGMFGKLSFDYQDKRLKAANQWTDGAIPTLWQVGESTMAMLFDNGDEPVAIVGSTTQGIRVAEQVDLSKVPEVLKGFITPEQDKVNFCYPLETGQLQIAARTKLIGFPLDLVLQLDPPGGSGTPDELDWSQGGLQVAGRMVLPPPFNAPWFDNTGTIKVKGQVGYTGQFLVSGTADVLLPVPGFAAFALGKPGAGIELTLSNEGAFASGEVTLPGGLGTLDLSGEVTPTGEFDFAVSGEVSPLGFTLADLSGTFSSSSGMSLTGKLAVPILAEPVVMTGQIRDVDDWSFVGSVPLTLPLGDGTRLANVTATLSPNGLHLSGVLRVPGLLDVPVTGKVELSGDGGSLTLSGGLSMGLGKLKLADGTISITVGCGGDGCNADITASGSVEVAGFRIAQTNVSIGTNGDIYVSGSTNFAGLSFGNAAISRTSSGTIGLSASKSVKGCVSKACISGEVSVGFDGSKVKARFNGAGFDVEVDSSGCVKVKLEIEVKVKLGPLGGWGWKLKLRTVKVCF